MLPGRKPGILAREMDDPSRDETKIFTGVQHFRQPIDRSLFIRGAHALYKCADRIVVGLASTVVHDSFLLDAFLRDCEIEMNGGVLAAPGSTTPATVAGVVNTPISRAVKALRALPSLTSARNRKASGKISTL
jgi:hypothetical protein